MYFQDAIRFLHWDLGWWLLGALRLALGFLWPSEPSGDPQTLKPCLLRGWRVPVAGKAYLFRVP